MTVLKTEQLAIAIAEIKTVIEDETEAYKNYTTELIKLVGEEGATFDTRFGAVQVTQKTEDRTTDEFVVVFDQEKYLSLSPADKATAEALGIVSMKRKEVKGQAPRVVVRLN